MESLSLAPGSLNSANWDPIGACAGPATSRPALVEPVMSVSVKRDAMLPPVA